MKITSAMVKELREKTGVGMMDCKNALVETDGDIEKAIKVLREKGLSAAAKKSDRSAKDGRVFTAIEKNQGAILELHCETDFVAESDPFVNLGNQLVNEARRVGVQDKDGLEGMTINGQSLKEALSELIQKIGENVVIGDYALVKGTGDVSAYNHANGKISVLVAFNSTVSEDIGRDMAMQVAATNPQYVRPEDVPKENLDEEKQIMRNQALAEGKPEQIADRIVEGKIKKYYKEVCLLEQAFIKDQDKSVNAILPEQVTVERFVRYALS